MTATDFTASADLVGRRIALRWSVFPIDDGVLPRVMLRRKERDFNFTAETEPYLLYDSGAFPPAEVPGELAVHPLAGSEDTVEGLRCTERICTVTRREEGRWIEIVRRTERTLFNVDRSVARQDVELLDAGGGSQPLQPGLTYYYQLDAQTVPATPLRATATPTGVHQYHRALYELLPAVYRRHDTGERPRDARTGLWPEANPAGGPLHRLTDVFATAVGALRSSADGLRGLRDVDLTDARFLPVLAQWIGWQLTDDDIARQRAEITAAPTRYRSVGTVAGVRAIIEHHTGMSVRIGEPAQNISLTNNAPQRNLFATVERGDDHWSGPDDAASALGLAGMSGPIITGAASEPFRLADGMSLWLSVDHASPAQVVFTSSDFVDIRHANATEVATVIGRRLRAVEADVVAGQLRLGSSISGARADIAVWQDSASLLTLDGAPAGRLAHVADAEGTDWLAYATTAGPGVARGPQLLLKTRVAGRWYDACAVADDVEAQADPALAVLTDRLWCAWVSDPHVAGSRLRYRLGDLPRATPARLRSDAGQPFRLAADTALAIVDSTGQHVFTVQEADYQDLNTATAAEVAAAFNQQRAANGPLLQANADGTLSVVSDARGPEVTMRVDLAASTAAWALGFGARSLVDSGRWDPKVAWGIAHEVAGVPAGRHADCTAAVETDGAVRLCWSMHLAQVWRLMSSRWTDRVLAATASGLTIVTPQAVSTLTTSDGLPSDDVRRAAVDGEGTVWFATAAGLVARTLDGETTVHTAASTAGGLLSDDVRGVAIDADGAVWSATAAGISVLTAGGDWTGFDTSAGLPSDDVRAVAVPLDGSVWSATAAGLAVRRSGAWHRVAASSTHPTMDVRGLAAGPDGTMWAATDSGLAKVGPDGATTVFDLAAMGSGAADVRDLSISESTVWLATAAGVVEWRGTYDARLHADIGGDDCRAIVATDGEIWVGTASGIVTRGTDGQWRSRAAGVAATALAGSWSAPGFLGDAGDGERDPHLLRDGTTVTLVAARRTRTATGDTWQITLRRKPDGAAWSPPTELTMAEAQDREPALTLLSGGRLGVYFRSDRSGGNRIWRLELSSAGTASAPTPVTTGASTETNPVVLAADDNPDSPLLIMRSDRNVTLSGVAPSTDGPAPQQVSVRRFAGSGTAIPRDTARNGMAGTFGELLDYTPQRPRGDAAQPNELYTPGTVAVFFAGESTGESTGLNDPQRLRRLLSEFLPANVRVVTIANP